jgi:hypothetical protein
MTDEEKLKVFEKHIKMISTQAVRDFVEFVLLRVPEYFWTLPISTSGRQHSREETLVDHIQGCLFIAECVIDQFDGHWTKKQKDQLFAALILHDCWRCGEVGNEKRFTQKNIDDKGCSQELLGNLRTSSDHPEVGYQNLLCLSAEFNQQAAANKQDQIGGKNLSPILKGVRYHYGPWTNCKKPFSLSWPYDSVVMQVHNIDYHQCKNAVLWTRIRK